MLQAGYPGVTHIAGSTEELVLSGQDRDWGWGVGGVSHLKHGTVSKKPPPAFRFQLCGDPPLKCPRPFPVHAGHIPGGHCPLSE